MSQIIIRTPNEKMLEQLIIEEARIRSSPEYQDKCTAVKDIPNGWLTLTDTLQQDIARNHGFNDPVSCSVTCNMMRRAHILFPDNKNFTTIPVQVRENKARQGTLKPGDHLPNNPQTTIRDVMLCDLSGNMIHLSTLLAHSFTTIIVAGSQT